MSLRALAAGAISAAALTLAPVAHAGTVNVDINGGDTPQPPPAGFLNYVAAPGEQNDLKVTYHDGHWLFHDAISPVHTDNCMAIDEHTVDCDAGDGPDFNNTVYVGLVGMTISTGDGDDTISTGPLARRVQELVKAGPGDDKVTAEADGEFTTPEMRGGEGDDVLIGSPIQDLMSGGPGTDSISGEGGPDVLGGGRGSDKLSGGEGDDTLEDRGEAGVADSFAGDAGNDTVSYYKRKDPVVVDLAARRSSDGDTFTDIENAGGGNGADTLLGDAGPNLLAGDDGRDSFRGGAGDDAIDSEDGQLTGGSELVRCGGGEDTITTRDYGDRLATDCERAIVDRDSLTPPTHLVIQPLRLSAHRLSGLLVSCTPEATPKGCRGTVTAKVRRGKRLVTIGHATVAAKPGQRVGVPIRLLSDAPQKLQRAGLHAIRIEVRLDVRGRPPYEVQHLIDGLTTFARR